MYMVPPGEALDPFKLIISMVFEPLWVYGLLGDMLTSIVSNSHFGKRLVAKVMIILSSLFLPMSPAIYFLMNEIFISRAPGHLQR